MRPDSHRSVRSISVMISLMSNIQTLSCSLDCVLLCCAPAGSRGVQCHRQEGGRQTPGELDYTSLMRGDRRHSLPPTYLSFFHYAHTQTYATLQTAHLASVDSYNLFKSVTCEGLKNSIPASHRTLSYKKAWHKNGTDVLFKWQSKHFINHLCGFPQRGWKKGKL